VDDSLARLAAQLAELGLHSQIDPAPHPREPVGRTTLRLTHGTSAQQYELVYGPAVRLSTVAPAPNHGPCFVYTPHVSAKTADSFRRIGVQYLDAEGNAWIQFADVLIDVRGRPRPADATPRAGAAGNLFSSGRAQVVLVLLAWPELWHAPQRVLARTAGVSLGQAHGTLALLARAGYDRDEPRGRAGLLDLWAAAFPTGLAQRLTLATYRGEIGQLHKVHAGDEISVSGEAAVPHLLRAATLTLYVAELDPRLPIVNRWRTDGEPNVVVRRKFWNDPFSGPLASAPEPEVAPWPLVYTDLLTSDDPRARSAAHQYRDSNERPQ
jgi:hypothetical protein